MDWYNIISWLNKVKFLKNIFRNFDCALKNQKKKIAKTTAELENRG